MTLGSGRLCRLTSVPSLLVLSLLVFGGVLYWHYGTKTGVTVYTDLEKRVVLPGPALPDDVESHGTRMPVKEPECVKVGPGEVPPLGRVACTVDYHFTPPRPVARGLPGHEAEGVPVAAHEPEPNLRGRTCDRPEGCEEALPPAPEYTEICKDNQTQCVTLDKGIVCIDSSLDCDVLDDDEYRILRCEGPACKVGDVKPCPTILPGNKINCEELKAMLTPRVTKPKVKVQVQGVEVHKQQDDGHVAKVIKKEPPTYGSEFGLDLKPDAISKFKAGKGKKTKVPRKGREYLADELTSKDAGFGLDLDLPKVRDYVNGKKAAKAPKAVKPAKVYKDLELELDLPAIQKKFGKGDKGPKKAKVPEKVTKEEAATYGPEFGLDLQPDAIDKFKAGKVGKSKGPEKPYEPPGGYGRVITMPGADQFRGRVELGDVDLLD